MAFALWPDSTEGQARTNLRHLLHTLRQAGPDLTPHLEVTAHTLRWRTELPNWVDVVEFDAALARADAHTDVHTDAHPHGDAGSVTYLAADPTDVLDDLRAAVGLYGGDLLEGLRRRVVDRATSPPARPLPLRPAAGRTPAGRGR